MAPVKFVVYIIIWNPLTHWGQGKMAYIFQTTFLYAFSWMKMYEFWLCSQGSNQQYSSTGSDDGLRPTRPQAIIWTNDG